MRTRIMIAADSGCGKTHAALSFASERLLKEPDLPVFVIDLDDSMDYEIDKFPDVKAKLTNDKGLPQNWYKIADYEGLMTAVTKAQQVLAKGGVLIIEGLERGWELAQDTFTEAVFGKSSGEHLQSLRASAVAQTRLQAPVSYDNARDWPSIRKLWKNNVLVPLTSACPWDVVATCSAKKIVALDSQGEKFNVNPFIKGIFGDIGIAPEGEKSDVKRFDLAVCLGMNGGIYLFSIAKNRTGTGVRPSEVRWTNRPFLATLENALKGEKEDAGAEPDGTG